MQNIISAVKLTMSETKNYIRCMLNALPTLKKPTDTILDDLN